MSAVIIIPARYASSRFPGKPLAQICGQDGIKRPLIDILGALRKRYVRRIS